MSYDLDEMVNFDGKDVSLFTAIRMICEMPPEKRNPGLAIFREQGETDGAVRLAGRREDDADRGI
jgi:hypothetical protein